MRPLATKLLKPHLQPPHLPKSKFSVSRNTHWWCSQKTRQYVFICLFDPNVDKLRANASSLINRGRHEFQELCESLVETKKKTQGRTPKQRPVGLWHFSNFCSWEMKLVRSLTWVPEGRGSAALSLKIDSDARGLQPHIAYPAICPFSSSTTLRARDSEG